MKKQLSRLEKRIAKLEAQSKLFEEHRQSWIDLNKKLKKLNADFARDAKRQARLEARIKRKVDAAMKAPAIALSALDGELSKKMEQIARMTRDSKREASKVK